VYFGVKSGQYSYGQLNIAIPNFNTHAPLMVTKLDSLADEGNSASPADLKRQVNNFLVSLNMVKEAVSTMASNLGTWAGTINQWLSRNPNQMTESVSQAMHNAVQLTKFLQGEEDFSSEFHFK
jgi:hypothetical protein